MVERNDCVGAICDQTKRALWEVTNVIDCIPDEIWERMYCKMPLWKHVYHMLHSLDQWFIDPNEYSDPMFHTKDLNNLDVVTEKTLTRADTPYSQNSNLVCNEPVTPSLLPT